MYNRVHNDILSFLVNCCLVTQLYTKIGGVVIFFVKALNSNILLRFSSYILDTTNLLEKGDSLNVLLKKLNNKMMGMYNLSDLSQNNYYTMVILIIDTDKKSIKYSNCGHPGFYMLHKRELIELDYDKRKGIEALEKILMEYIGTDESIGLLSYIKLNLLDKRNTELHDDVTMTSVSIHGKGVD